MSYHLNLFSFLLIIRRFQARPGCSSLTFSIVGYSRSRYSVWVGAKKAYVLTFVFLVTWQGYRNPSTSFISRGCREP